MEAACLHWKMMDTLRRLGGSVEKNLHPFCSRHNITALQLSLLMTLHFEGEQTVTGLARRSCMADANNSALCKKMEKDGLVERRRDPKDERQVLVSLSAKGEHVIHTFTQACEKSRQLSSEKMTEQELTGILEGLESLMIVLRTSEEEPLI